MGVAVAVLRKPSAAYHSHGRKSVRTISCSPTQRRKARRRSAAARYTHNQATFTAIQTGANR